MGDTMLIHPSEISQFDYRDLHGKNLLIRVAENSRYLKVFGIDNEDGIIYVIQDIDKEKYR